MATGVSDNFNVSTSNPYISGNVSYSETYDVAKNTSDVTVTFKVWRNNDYEGGTTPAKASTFKLLCNGVSHSITIAGYGITIPPGGTKVTVGSYTFTEIAHGSDGSKSVNIAVEGSFVNCGSAGTIKVSLQKQTVTLTKIARLSSLSASNGTLGTSQNLTVTQQNSAYTHTITYACGSTSGTVVSKSSNVTIPFTPPLSLASQNTTGTSVSIEFTITTYNGNTSLGSSKKTITCSIPSSVKPEVSMSIIDPTGYLSTYNTAIKGKSTLQITLSATLGGSSPINSYSITANGETYTTSSAVTSVLKTSGTMIVAAKVTDKRGRTDTATAEIEVLDYNAPSITSLSVRRCNQNGTENDQGAYIKVTFSGSVTPLNDNNSARWSIQYKPTSTQLYSTVSIPALNDHYSVSGYEYIFAADTGKSYDVRVHVQDDFEELYRTTAASTALTIMHFKANGKGMGIGKISELDNVLDIGFQTRFYGGIKYMEITSGTNLNDLTTPGFYCCSEAYVSTLVNCPFTDGASFTLKIEAMGTSNQIRQEIITCHEVNQKCFIRVRYSNTWYNWQNYVPRGSFVMNRGAATNNDFTINSTNTWSQLTLNDSIGNNESSYLSYALYTDNTYIKTRIPGFVVLSGAVRLKNGLQANDVISVRFTRTFVDENGNNAVEALPGVWDQLCHANNSNTCVVTPNIIFNAHAEDKFALEVRNSTGARGSIIPTDCIFSLYYL